MSDEQAAIVIFGASGDLTRRVPNYLLGPAVEVGREPGAEVVDEQGVRTRFADALEDATAFFH